MSVGLRQFTYFFPGSYGTDKSHLVKVIYNVILQTLLYQCKESKKPGVLLLEPAVISVVNVGGNTIHFSLRNEPWNKAMFKWQIQSWFKWQIQSWFKK